MPNCSLLGCSGRSGKRFPEDPELREKWLEKINRTDFEPTPNALVCYKHFRTSDFVPDTENKDKSGRKRKKKRLKPTAIPSYFLSPTAYTYACAQAAASFINPSTMDPPTSPTVSGYVCACT